MNKLYESLFIIAFAGFLCGHFIMIGAANKWIRRLSRILVFSIWLWLIIGIVNTLVNKKYNKIIEEKLDFLLLLKIIVSFCVIEAAILYWKQSWLRLYFVLKKVEKSKTIDIRDLEIIRKANARTIENMNKKHLHKTNIIEPLMKIFLSENELKVNPLSAFAGECLLKFDCSESNQLKEIIELSKEKIKKFPTNKQYDEWIYLNLSHLYKLYNNEKEFEFLFFPDQTITNTRTVEHQPGLDEGGFIFEYTEEFEETIAEHIEIKLKE